MDVRKSRRVWCNGRIQADTGCWPGWARFLPSYSQRVGYLSHQVEIDIGRQVAPQPLRPRTRLDVDNLI